METTENRISAAARQNPLTFYLRTLLYMFMALLMRAVALAPLAALLLFPEGSYWRWLALLCPLLFIFFILPLRFSFAQALVQPARERRFSFDKATSVSMYGAKLGEGLVHALNIVKWGIPLLLMLGGCYYCIQYIDAITLTKAIESIGQVVVSIAFAVANFFLTILGKTPLLADGGLMEGVYTVCATLGLGVLILLWGIVRNSAFRYIWAAAKRDGLRPRAEARRRLTGRRWKQLGVALINLILWAPALYILFTSVKSMVSDLSQAAFNYLATKTLALPDFTSALQPLLFAFLACYMPLLPVRRMLTAFFATKRLRHAAPDTAHTAATYEYPKEPEAQAPVEATPSTASVAPIAPIAMPVMPADMDEEDPPEAKQPAEQPMPVPAYTPYAEPYRAAEAPVYQPVYQPVAAPVAEPEPVAAPAPVYAPEPEVVPVAAPVYAPEPEPAPVAAPVYAAEPYAAAEEDAFEKPFARPLYDAAEAAEPETPADGADAEETDK